MASKLQTDQSDDLLYVKRGDVYCGYRREYLAQNLSKMEEGLVVCKKCSGIMREASFSKGKTTCLVCSETPKQPNPVHDVRESIGVLRIKCPLLRDCDWKGELSQAETHLKVCLFFRTQCKECKQIFPRGDEEKHKSNSCPKRNIECKYCYSHGEAKDKEKHLQFCYKFPTFCPNKCGAKLKRKGLSEHRTNCELEWVACPYKEYGCKAKDMLRRDLLAHKKENIVEHTDMSLVEIKQLKTENVRLKKEQDVMKWKIKSMKQLDGVEWEFKNIDILRDGEEIEGPTFHVNNYKLRIHFLIVKHTWIVDPTIFSFHLRRIEGEFDSNLGLAYITHYRVIKVNKQDYNESEYREGRMKYQLKIGTRSEQIEWHNNFRYCHGEQDLLLRFYFDINTTSEPLKSLDVEYSGKTPPLNIPGDDRMSLREEDPWNDFYNPYLDD